MCISFGPCAVRHRSAMNLTMRPARSAAGGQPQAVGRALRLGCQHVGHVEPEGHEPPAQRSHLGLVDGYQVGVGSGLERPGRCLVQSENALGLYGERRPYLFGHGIAPVGRARHGPQRAVGQQQEPPHGVAFVQQRGGPWQLYEVEPRAGHKLFELVVAHALEEREAQQRVVQLQGRHWLTCESCLSSMASTTRGCCLRRRPR